MLVNEEFRGQVPEFKKGLGAVSVIIFSEDFKSFVGMHDFEKSSTGKQRFALPGGTKEVDDRGDAQITAMREAMEEMGHAFKPKDLVQIPYFVNFGNDLRKDFFVALLPSNTQFRATGTRQVIPRNGQDVDMEVLGPPNWIPLEGALKLPPRGWCPDDKFYLHPSHLRGVIEAVFYLKAQSLENKIPAFGEMWLKLGLRLSDLRDQLDDR